LGEGLIEKLTVAGVTTVEALADMTPEQLEAIEGIGPKTVEKISLAVNNYFSSLDAGEEAAEAPAEAELATPEASETAEAIEAGEETPATEQEAGTETEAVEAGSAEAAVVESEGTADSEAPAEEPAPSEEKQ